MQSGRGHSREEFRSHLSWSSGEGLLEGLLEWLGEGGTDLKGKEPVSTEVNSGGKGVAPE